MSSCWVTVSSSEKGLFSLPITQVKNLFAMGCAPTQRSRWGIVLKFVSRNAAIEQSGAKLGIGQEVMSVVKVWNAQEPSFGEGGAL